MGSGATNSQILQKVNNLLKPLGRHGNACFSSRRKISYWDSGNETSERGHPSSADESTRSSRLFSSGLPGGKRRKVKNADGKALHRGPVHLERSSDGRSHH